MSARLSPGNEKEKGFYYGVPEGKGGEKDRRMENLQLVRRNEVGGKFGRTGGAAPGRAPPRRGGLLTFFCWTGGPGVAGRGKRVCELSPLVASPLWAGSGLLQQYLAEIGRWQLD